MTAPGIWALQNQKNFQSQQSMFCLLELFVHVVGWNGIDKDEANSWLLDPQMSKLFS